MSFSLSRGSFSGSDFSAGDFDILTAVPIGTDCPAPGWLSERALSRVITQYREAARLKDMIRVYAEAVEEAASEVCALPDYFDIDTAVGDQLTIIGKRLGWPRSHCVCVTSPVFGFACEGVASPYEIVGFCAQGSTWVGCGDVGAGMLTLSDDAVYRAFLKVRRYQALGLYDVASLTASVQTMWGASASVITTPQSVGTVTLAPGRVLSAYETTILPLALRVMPVAPGIRPMVHTSPLGGRIFGFGEGWGGFCEMPSAEWLCPTFIDPYDCA